MLPNVAVRITSASAAVAAGRVTVALPVALSTAMAALSDFHAMLTPAALVGSALHFGYDLCPSPLVGLICPVTESVWEHLKLLYWPFLASGFLLNRKAQDAQAAWSGTLAALLVMPAFLLGIYYILESGFAFTAGWLNIALYVLSLALGFWLMARLTKTGGLSWLCGVLVIAAGLYGAALILFTMAPPALPIFLD